MHRLYLFFDNFFSTNARSQGTSGTFADPIGLIEFAELLKKNGVEFRDQYAAVEAAHVKYLESCLNCAISRFSDSKKRC